MAGENILENQTHLSDLDMVINTFPEVFAALAGKSVLVTGASGLICSAVCDLIIMNNEKNGADTVLYACGRDEGKLKRRFGKYAVAPYFHFVQYDSVKSGTNIPETDFVIHGAGAAYPSAFAEDPAGVLTESFDVLRIIVESGSFSGGKRLLYISSSEVYTALTGGKYTEDQKGCPDPLASRSAYPVNKISCECLLASKRAVLGTDFVIARPGHIFGPTASRADNRISSTMGYDAAEGRDIVLKSDGMSVRSYTYMLDCASAILFLLMKGVSGEAYNISNPDAITTIRGLAEAMADAGGVKVLFERPTDAEKKAFNPMNDSSLDSTKLEALGWKGLFGTKEATEHTVKILSHHTET